MKDDTISRAAAIDALDALCDRECEYSKKQRNVMCGACHLGTAFDVIEQLPSAQPEIAENLYLYKCFITDKDGLQHEVIHTGDIRRVTGWEI